VARAALPAEQINKSGTGTTIRHVREVDAGQHLDSDAEKSVPLDRLDQIRALGTVSGYTLRPHQEMDAHRGPGLLTRD
jgi:hypothetical protein